MIYVIEIGNWTIGLSSKDASRYVYSLLPQRLNSTFFEIFAPGTESRYLVSGICTWILIGFFYVVSLDFLRIL